AVPGATVTVTNPETQFIRRTTTDETGLYRIDLLPPGTYDIKVERQGFNPYVLHGTTLTVGGSVSIDLKLSVAAGSALLEVRAETPLLEATRSQQANTIEQRAITDLPIN